MSPQPVPLNIGVELTEILASERVPADLIVTYDDMHGLWGGSTFTVRGDGHIERQVRSPGAPEPESSTRQIGDPEIVELLRLLVEIFAWAQRTPDSVPVPDESRAYLTISLDGKTSRVWERFNDMRENDRLIRVKRWLESRF